MNINFYFHNYSQYAAHYTNSGNGDKGTNESR